MIGYTCLMVLLYFIDLISYYVFRSKERTTELLVNYINMAWRVNVSFDFFNMMFAWFSFYFARKAYNMIRDHAKEKLGKEDTILHSWMMMFFMIF